MATLTLGNEGASSRSVPANGELVELRAYARALTSSEVAALYAAGSGWGARHVNVLVETIQPWTVGGRPNDRGFVSTLAVDGDARWRSRAGDLAYWYVRADSAEIVVDNQGDDDAYPVLTLTPATAKSSGYSYRRWVPVVWLADEGYTQYPIMLGPFDTGALVTAGKAQNDGDDWRVEVDGVQTDRWFGSSTAAFNQSTTKTWANLNFQAGQQATLATAIGAGDSIDSIEVNEDISGFPSAGILLLDNGSNTEAFVYTSKNNDTKTFLGVTRTARGSTARAFSVSDDVYWVQHDVWIIYGNSSVTAPTQDDDYQPAFNLTSSTNTSWVYADFGEDDGLRSGQWTRSGGAIFYDANQGGNADPWEEMGIQFLPQEDGHYQLYNPCGITNVNFTNGEKRAQDKTLFKAGIRSSSNGVTFATEYSIPAPSSDNTWESWSRNEALASGAQYVRLSCNPGSVGSPTVLTSEVEAADCTVTLNSSYTPDVSIGSEQGNYSLAATITNETTGDAVTITMTMALDQVLEVDTDRKTVTLLDDGSGQLQARELDTVRQDWLRLISGENTLTFEDTGTQEVLVGVVWDRRGME
jgi:hypothetical protein